MPDQLPALARRQVGHALRALAPGLAMTGRPVWLWIAIGVFVGLVIAHFMGWRA